MLSAAWKATHTTLVDTDQSLLPMNLPSQWLAARHHQFQEVILLSVMHMPCSNLAQNPSTNANLIQTFCDG